MKIIKMGLLALASFVLGSLISYSSLKSNLEESKAACKYMKNEVMSYFGLLEEQRAMDGLEATLDAVGYITSLQSRGAPRRYIGEEYRKMIQKRLDKLESVRKDVVDSGAIRKSDFLINQAEAMLVDIDEAYGE